jgi:hypothetical protein
MAKFVDSIIWPEESSVNDTTKPFIITVIGNNPFNGELKRLFLNKKIKIRNKKVKLQFISDSDEITNCNILFISKTEKNNLKKILNKVKDMPVLTISDSPGFAEVGTIINFYTNKEGNIRFEINYKKTFEAKISISSRLLKIAKIVE